MRIADVWTSRKDTTSLMKPAALFTIALCVLPLQRCAHASAPYPKSDHYDGKRFHNAQPVTPTTFGDEWKIFWQLQRKHGAWPKHFDTPLHTIDEATVADGPTATYIGHATALIQVAGLNILTDPLLFDYAGPNRVFSEHRVTNAGVSADKLPSIDVILISHDHYDHLDVRSLQFLVKRQAKNPPLVITGLGNRSLLERHGIKNVSELDWNGSVTIKNLTFHFLEAIHSSRRGLWDADKSLWGSFLIQTPEGNIYFAGDTAYGKHFNNVYAKFGPTRLAFLPIGAYKPRWFMAREHMDPEEAVQAHLDLHSSQSIAIHFDTLNAAQESFDDPVNDTKAALNQHAVNAERFLLLRPGQVLSMDSSQPNPH